MKRCQVSTYSGNKIFLSLSFENIREIEILTAGKYPKQRILKMLSIARPAFNLKFNSSLIKIKTTGMYN